jgi:hypothetical protein
MGILFLHDVSGFSGVYFFQRCKLHVINKRLVHMLIQTLFMMILCYCVQYFISSLMVKGFWMNFVYMEIILIDFRYTYCFLKRVLKLSKINGKRKQNGCLESVWAKIISFHFKLTWPKGSCEVLPSLGGIRRHL